MVYQGFEHQMMSTARYTVKGEQEVIVLRFAELWGFLSIGHIQTWDRKAENVNDFVQRCLRTLSVADVSSLMECGVHMWRSVVHSGSFLYVPHGMVIFERTIGGHDNIGIRVAALDSANETDLKVVLNLLSSTAHETDKFYAKLGQMSMLPVLIH
jgi:hypothetical protein